MIEELYTSYHNELVKWCQTMTDSHELAEELVQEAYLRAMLHQDILEMLQEKQRRAWLYRTVKNLYIDNIRHRSFEDVVEDVPENVEEPHEFTEFEWIKLLESLPDIEGVLFSLRYLQGYNSNQLGRMFNLPPGTVRSKLSSARKHLRQSIGGKNNV